MKLKMLKFEYLPLIRRMKEKSLRKVPNVKAEGTVDLGMIKAKVRMELWSETCRDSSITQWEAHLLSKEAAAEQREKNGRTVVERSREETAKLMAKIAEFYKVPARIEPIYEIDGRLVDKTFKKLMNTYARNIARLSRGKEKYEKMVFPRFDGSEEFGDTPGLK